MSEPIGTLDEQESGYIAATITDHAGAMLPGSTLTALRLTQYVVRQDGSTAIVNNRNHQNVLNMANVSVYDVLQTLPDGRTYNLLWNVQPADTTLVEALLFETHYYMFEWSWPGGEGKQEKAYVVRALRMVP
jgi:hypothetical protein